MSDSESDYKDSVEPRGSPSDEEEDYKPASRRVSSTPLSPRKRRRSESAEGRRTRKYHLEGKYNDAYRVLFNEDVNAAATRFVVDESLKPDDAQIGASKWSAHEKNLFFAALERLGKDDTPGISKAVVTKSIQEIRQFILLLEDAPTRRTALRGDSKMRPTLKDIPAAVEIDPECEDQLELSGDALAWFQETHEMKQEQARYGNYWLITSEVAEEIEESFNLQPQSHDSSPDSSAAEDKQNILPEPQILRDIPEARLLKPTEFLYLSKQFFMNPSQTVRYPWPHWSELVTEHAREPSIYRTAFIDLHTLAVSLTKRIVQIAIVQAASRVRSQGWRVKKGVKPYVKPRDVYTAADLLGLKRNGHQRWAGVARRCGLRVKDRDRGVQGDGQRREVSWDEVEQLLGMSEMVAEPINSDAGHISGIDSTNFRARAIRSGTPLPAARHLSSGDSNSGSDEPQPSSDELDSDPDNYEQPEDSSDASTLIPSDFEPSHDALEEEHHTAEAFDQAASEQAQRQLWEMLATTASIKQDSSDAKHTTKPPESKRSRNRLNGSSSSDWRQWTRYRSEWETNRNPIALTEFLINKKKLSIIAQDDGTQSEAETGKAAQQKETDTRKRRKPKSSRIDIPIRGTRAYAAMHDRDSVGGDQAHTSDPDSVVGYREEGSEGGEADVPTQSIEEDAAVPASHRHENEMDWE